MTDPDFCSLLWRTGTHVGRTIYAVTGSGDYYQDVLIGVMDTPELAAEAVRAHNSRIGEDGHGGATASGLTFPPHLRGPPVTNRCISRRQPCSPRFAKFRQRGRGCRAGGSRDHV